jgi:hypothetical protein
VKISWNVVSEVGHDDERLWPIASDFFEKTHNNNIPF